MLIEDTIHPLFSDFLREVTGLGYNFLNTESSSRLNDFTKYIASITADNANDFAFYPLRKGQNAGVGNFAIGIGYMASGSPMYFPKSPKWDESGVVLGTLNNVGIINFSGKLKDTRFQFRESETTVFYFLKHNRPKFETSLYRGGQVCPYFWFDDSPDNFGIIADEFSTSDFRTTGTTYLYDEIYGGDKKGYRMDFSSTSTVKYNVFTLNTGRGSSATIANYKQPPVSFYEIDNNENKFVCINTVIKKDSYLLRSFFGRDYRTLTGWFPNPYKSIEIYKKDNPEELEYIDHFFPRRMVIGAGVNNDSISGYDIAGLDHICAGILILRGDYSHKAKNIAENMAEALGIKNRNAREQSTPELIGDVFVDNYDISPSVNSINYYDFRAPIEYKTYSDYIDLYNFAVTMTGIRYINNGKWVFNEVNDVTGELRSPEVNKVIQLIPEIYGVSSFVAVSGLNLPSFGSYYNRGVIGFVSGNIEYGENANSYFTRFTEETISGGSGFYILNQNGQVSQIKYFSPTREVFTSYITGYISGIKDAFDIFTPFDSGSELYSSGYFIDNTVYKYPKIKLIPQNINGYISGFLFENGEFSGFNGIDSSSGYFYEADQFEFLPKKILNLNPVTGFLIGLKSGDYFSGFYQNNPIDGLYSGVFVNNDFSNEAEIDPIVELYFPTGIGLFSGFTGMYGFDDRIGFEYDGFLNFILDENGEILLDENDNPIVILFDGNSGFVDISEGPYPNTRIVSVTGIIGSRNFLNFSGEFNGFENITTFDKTYGYGYSGFFVDSSGFSGTEIDPITQEIKTNGTGIFTGIIGYFNNFEYVNLTGFDDEINFPFGGYLSGFFPLSSGFSGFSDPYGTGIMTGLIGYKFGLKEYGEFSGFSGFSEFSKSFLNEINIDMNFSNGSGFSGLEYPNSGIGIVSGLITTGKSPLLFGDPIYFVPNIVSILYSGNNIVFYTGDFVYTGVVPDITGINYLSGFIFTYSVQSGTMITGDHFITGVAPSIVGISYYDASDSYLDDFDFSSRDYVLRLESYEGQKLESGVRFEINKLISGLKQDNIWNKINDAFLMAGPRTHSGILIPLKDDGKTGIGYNFTNTDYSRTGGLIGDGVSKYINTQHNLNQEPTGSQHIIAYITQTGSSINQYYFGAGIQSETGSSAIYASGSTSLFMKSRAPGLSDYEYLSPITGFMGISRFNTGVWVARNDNLETPFIYTENGAQPANIYLFANNNTDFGAGTAEEYSDSRMAFYSVGVNLDLMSLYKSRIETYLSGIKQYIS